MTSQSREKLRERLISYFVNGAGTDRRLGVEIEHFLTDLRSGETLPYDGPRGMEEFLRRFAASLPEIRPIREEGHLLGFETPGYTITLDPAAQLEISIVPENSIRTIREIYEDFLKKASPILRDMDAVLQTCGYQPRSRVADLPLIPKERYRLMDAHFAGTGDGRGGRQMMRGTASTQISIDYSSEEDFRRKLQALAVLSPLLRLLCENTPVFEGAPYTGHLLRTDIWRRTDPVRCGYPPGIFRPDYGFADYAGWLLDVPLILMHRGDGTRDTGTMTAAEVYAGRDTDEEDLRHILSMVFPDVRLKRYLEIRFADAVSGERMLAYCALVKGIFYTEAGLTACEELLGRLTDPARELIACEDELMRAGWDGMLYGESVRDAAIRFIDLAGRNLEEEERAYLEGFEGVIG